MIFYILVEKAYKGNQTDATISIRLFRLGIVNFRIHKVRKIITFKALPTTKFSRLLTSALIGK